LNGLTEKKKKGKRLTESNWHWGSGENPAAASRRSFLKNKPKPPFVGRSGTPDLSPQKKKEKGWDSQQQKTTAPQMPFEEEPWRGKDGNVHRPRSTGLGKNRGPGAGCPIRRHLQEKGGGLRGLIHH